MRPFRELSFGIAVSLAAFAACEPDLAPLSAEYYNGGQVGTGGFSGSNGSGGLSSGGAETGGSDSGGSMSAAGSGPMGGSGQEGGTTSTEGGNDATGGEAPLPESCMDRRRSSDESDTDCGGTSRCPRCEVDGRCTRHSDCVTEICLNARCVEPSCGDGILNQNETGVDCGGVCAPASLCDNDSECNIHGDCKSGYCLNHVCADHCESKKKEADETGVDCGGSTCGPCGAGMGCLRVADCESGVCNNNVCQQPSCDDKVLNQDESDLDCGGACSPTAACPVDKKCNHASDCATYICTSGKCAADIPADSYSMVDNFEDGNLVLPSLEGRKGNWYSFSDGAGEASAIPALIPGKRLDSTTAIRFTTTGNKYFSGFGFDFYNPGQTETTKEPWDGSAYRGVTFWARASELTSTVLQLPDANTHIAGERCTVCDHHWGKFMQIDSEWRRYTVLFADLDLEAGTEPEPTAFDDSGIVLMQFFFGPNVTVELWVDDVALLK